MDINDLHLWNIAIALIIVVVVIGVYIKLKTKDKTEWCPRCGRYNLKARKETGNSKSKYTDNRGILFTDFEYKCEICDGLYWIRMSDKENVFVDIDKNNKMA